MSDQPFCHNAPDRQTDKQTNRWLEGMFDHYGPLLLYRELHGVPNNVMKVTTMTTVMIGNLWLNELHQYSLMLNVGPVDAHLHRHGVKHVQHDATGGLRAFLTIHTQTN